MSGHIYTRTGDDGQTSLFAGGRVGKDAVRLHAYGTIDELNSAIGFALAQKPHEELIPRLTLIQDELFVVGADLATPIDADSPRIVRVLPEQVTRLEREIDGMEARLPALKQFILPGGTSAAAALHMSRTVCRRAERWIVSLSREESINSVVMHYVNRLSDWLFVVARMENFLTNTEETKWRST
jgi:cob(I)alamin adenosyltransferase